LIESEEEKVGEGGGGRKLANVEFLAFTACRDSKHGNRNFVVKSSNDFGDRRTATSARHNPKIPSFRPDAFLVTSLSFLASAFCCSCH
jgi:hypothetical protein